MQIFSINKATPLPDFCRELSTLTPALSRIETFFTLAGQNSLSASFLFSTIQEVFL